MDTKRIIIGAFVCFLLFINARCIKTGLGCAEARYSFELNVRAYPDKDSMAIGDTIWFEVNESARFKDIRSGEIIDYSGAENLGYAL